MRVLVVAQNGSGLSWLGDRFIGEIEKRVVLP
jgi:hypothetical protein